MGISVRDRADTVATFRFINVYLMETLAGWVPTTPEMEVKVLFGRHLWDLAQHADAFGKRTGELRLGLHASRQPVSDFMAVLKRVSSAEDTSERVDGFYAAITSVLQRLYGRYLDETDLLMDEPTVRIVERAMADLTRMCREREELRKERPEIALADDGWVQQLTTTADAGAEFVNFRPEPQEAA